MHQSMLLSFFLLLISFFICCSAERSIASILASAMFYNSEKNAWEYCGGYSGLSNVILHHDPIQSSYRIVGTKYQDTMVCEGVLEKLFASL